MDSRPAPSPPFGSRQRGSEGGDRTPPPRPFVDPPLPRATVEARLGVGRRRTPPMLAPCLSDRVGTPGGAEREAFLTRCREGAPGEEASGERQRRQRVVRMLDPLRRERITPPPVLVKAPVRVVNQEGERRPAGVRRAAGRITVEFAEPAEALDRRLALARALRHDLDRFERHSRHASNTVPSHAGRVDLAPGRAARIPLGGIFLFSGQRPDSRHEKDRPGAPAGSGRRWPREPAGNFTRPRSSPSPKPYTKSAGAPQNRVCTVSAGWGPGRYQVSPSPRTPLPVRPGRIGPVFRIF
jgi:hypothetical protein